MPDGQSVLLWLLGIPIPMISDFVALALTPRDAGSGKAGFSRARGRAYFW